MLEKASVRQLAQVFYNNMRAIPSELFRIAFSGHTYHEPEAPIATSLHPGDGILNNHRAARLHLQEPCRQEECVRCRFAGKSLRVDNIAIDAHSEKIIQVCGLQNRITVLAGRDDGSFESVTMKLA